MSSKSPDSGGCRGGIFRADLKAYLDGELSSPRRMLVKFHVSRCVECQEEIAWLQRLGRSMRSLEGAQPSPQLRARILSTLPPMEAVPQAREAIKPRPRIAAGGIAAAAACALLLIALPSANHLFRHHANPAVNQPRPVNSPGNVAKRAEPAAHEVSPTIDASDIKVPVDPTSAEADRRLLAQEEEERRKMARQVSQLWSKAVNTVKSADPVEPGKGNQPSVMVAVSTDYPAKAAESLKKWLERQGAEAVPAGSEFVVRIGTEKANALFQQLRKSGQIASISTNLPASQPAIGVSDHRPIPAVPTDDHGNVAAGRGVPKTVVGDRQQEPAAKPAAKAITVVVMFGRM
jgi:Putative zinc-finger